MNKVLEYLNEIDKNAIALSDYEKDPVVAMSNFGLSDDEQSIILAKNEKAICSYIGMNVEASSSIIVNVVTY